MFPLLEETSHGVTEVAEVAVAVSSIRSSQVRHGAAVKGGSTLCQWQGGGREASKSWSLSSSSPLHSIYNLPASREEEGDADEQLRSKSGR